MATLTLATSIACSLPVERARLQQARYRSIFCVDHTTGSGHNQIINDKILRRGSVGRTQPRSRPTAILASRVWGPVAESAAACSTAREKRGQPGRYGREAGKQGGPHRSSPALPPPRQHVRWGVVKRSACSTAYRSEGGRGRRAGQSSPRPDRPSHQEVIFSPSGRVSLRYTGAEAAPCLPSHSCTTWTSAHCCAHYQRDHCSSCMAPATAL